MSARDLCQLSGLARSSLYRKLKPASEHGQQLRQAIVQAASDHPAYGTRRTTHQVRRQKLNVNRKRVQRVMHVYVAVVLDVFSRRVVGWAVGSTMKTELPMAALEQALSSRRPAPGWIHHSDQGWQYASEAYVATLRKAGARISMSRKGRPRDNAHVESFSGSSGFLVAREPGSALRSGSRWR